MTKRRGRPTLYNSQRPQDLIDLMAKGYFDSWVCSEWDIDRSIFYDWLRIHPEFKAAHDKGFEKRTVWWEKKGMDMMANGDNKGFNFWIAFMNKHHGWAKGTEGAGGNTTHVNIQQLNVLQSKSKEDLLQIVQTQLKALDMLPKTELPQKVGLLESHHIIEGEIDGSDESF